MGGDVLRRLQQARGEVTQEESVFQPDLPMPPPAVPTTSRQTPAPVPAESVPRIVAPKAEPEGTSSAASAGAGTASAGAGAADEENAEEALYDDDDDFESEEYSGEEDEEDEELEDDDEDEGEDDEEEEEASSDSFAAELAGIPRGSALRLAPRPQGVAALRRCALRSNKDFNGRWSNLPAVATISILRLVSLLRR